MDNALNYLQVLTESLNKKITILKELESLTLEQYELALKQDFDDAAFTKNVERKAGLVAELERLDKGFQLLYDNIKQQLEGNREYYRAQIQELQTKIKIIMDMSISLQIQESRNKDTIEKRFAKMKKEMRVFKKGRDTAANYYRVMNNISSEPHFLDKKK